VTSLEKALNQIGRYRNLTQLVKRLEREGIKGIPCSSGECPISVYLTQQVGNGVIVDGRSAWEELDYYNRHPLSPILRNFIHKFDTHQYPQLKRIEDENDSN
jgi:hypothetical protein